MDIEQLVDKAAEQEFSCQYPFLHEGPVCECIWRQRIKWAMIEVLKSVLNVYQNIPSMTKPNIPTNIVIIKPITKADTEYTYIYLITEDLPEGIDKCITMHCKALQSIQPFSHSN